MRTRVGLVLLVAACVVVVGCGGASDPSGQQETTTGGAPSTESNPGIPAREPVAAIAGESLDGGPIAVADFRGRPVLLNVWSSW